MKRRFLILLVISLLFSSCYFYDEIKGISCFCDVSRGVSKAVSAKPDSFVVPVAASDAKFANLVTKYPKLTKDMISYHKELKGKLYLVSYPKEKPLKGVLYSYNGDVLLYVFNVKKKDKEIEYMKSYMRCAVSSDGKTILKKAHSMVSDSLVDVKTGVVLDGSILVESSAEPNDDDIANYASMSNLEGWNFLVKFNKK